MIPLLTREIQILFFGVLVLGVINATDDWEKTCPKTCHCKYYNNKKVVECEGAGFSTVPSSLSSSIHVLDLTNNNIRSLDKNIFKKMNLINLHKLTLTGNQIEYVHKDAFKDLILLMDLDLSNNHIRKLHPETFTGMVKMRKLILSGNFFTRLEYQQFPDLPNLHHLRIDNCNLSYINNEAFANLKSVNTVSLKGNRLHLLNADLFTRLPNLKSVELVDNLWNCDCKLRGFVAWFQDTKMGENQVVCYYPKRLNGKLWHKLEKRELACAPRIIIPQSEVAISIGGNATLTCGARGEPLPRMNWILDGRLLSNETELSFPSEEPEADVTFALRSGMTADILWTNLTVIQIGDDFMLHGYDQNAPFKCVVENAAKNVERNVTLVIGTVVESPIITGTYLDAYVIAAIVSVALLVLVLLAMICFCYARRLRPRSSPLHMKAAGDEADFLEKNNIVIVNPVEKPPRKGEVYEKVPQSDIELTDLTKGAHQNFEEMNYPEERLGRVRSPLTPLEEEVFHYSNQKLLNESLNSTVPVDFSLQYPDLLDNLKYSRAVSPSQLSYRSLINPMHSPAPDWRYSFASYPSDYSAPPASRLSQASPASFHQRPGYVTLPRRPRTSSVTSAPPLLRHQLGSPSVNADPIYDTLGPRRTANGTSRTDLSNPVSPRAFKETTIVNEPFSTLPLHYVPILEDFPQLGTLPRSTQNFTGNKSLRALPQISGKSKFTPTSPKIFNAVVNNNYPHKEKMKGLSNANNEKIHFDSSGTSGRNMPSTDQTVNYKNKNNEDVNNSSVNTTESANHPLTNGVCNGDRFPPAGITAKKIPPKLLPKPSAKRLSISSVSSDPTTPVMDSRAAIVVRQSYQGEGPDGTEV